MAWAAYDGDGFPEAVAEYRDEILDEVAYRFAQYDFGGPLNSTMRHIIEEMKQEKQ